jgi:acetyltransferase-like isoleucine patch superfamily enzyme
MELIPIKEIISEVLQLKDNQFHPLVLINGDPIVGHNVYIGAFSEINANHSSIVIGDNCDIASFVAINCADSHKRCIGRSDKIDRKEILIGDNVFIGSHTIIKGGAIIGHHSVIGAGTVVNAGVIEPYSLVCGNPMTIKSGYYKDRRYDTT